MREKIASILGQLTKRIIEWEKSDMPDFNKSIEIFSELEWAKKEILSLMREGIKKVENPYWNKIAVIDYLTGKFEGFEEFRQKILKALEEK